MRKLIFLLFLLLLATPCFGQDMARMSLGVVGSQSPTTGGGYLINQNFEGTGYDNSETWTETVGTNGSVNEDYATSPAPLRGSQSLRIYAGDAGQNSNTISPVFTAQDTAYAHLMINGGSVASTFAFCVFLDSGLTARAWVSVVAGGALKVSEGAITATTVGTIVAATTYHVWFRYTKGTGADSIASVGFSETTTEPTSGDNYASISNGAATAQITNIQLQTSFQQTYIFDYVLVSVTAIGNVPE